MLSHLKAAAKWSFQTTKGDALARLTQSVASVLFLAVLNAWDELGLSGVLRWTLAIPLFLLALALGLLNGRRWEQRPRTPIWHVSGWGWTPTGLLVGCLLLWPIRLAQGPLTAAYPAARQLPLIAHVVFGGGVFLLAVGIWLTARRRAESGTEEA